MSSSSSEERAEQLAKDVMSVKQIGTLPPNMATVESVASWLHDRILAVTTAALRAERQAVWEEAAKYLTANDACYKLRDGSCHDVELCGIETAEEFRRRATEKAKG